MELIEGTDAEEGHGGVEEDGKHNTANVTNVDALHVDGEALDGPHAVGHAEDLEPKKVFVMSILPLNVGEGWCIRGYVRLRSVQQQFRVLGVHGQNGHPVVKLVEVVFKRGPEQSFAELKMVEQLVLDVELTFVCASIQNLVRQ